MSTLTRRTRRMATMAAGLAMAGALAAPAAAAHASARNYTPPDSREWYFSKWLIQRDVWPSTTGAGVTVAVVDSGVQANVLNLQGVVKPGADMLGYPGNGEKDYASGGGHGTGMASLIAGQGQGIGPTGLAPHAKILPVHVIDPHGGGATPIAKGIRYAADHGAAVINLSLGGIVDSPTSCYPVEQAAIDHALARNAVVVASAGDANQMGGQHPLDPGTCAGVLTVGGVEQDGSLWSSSMRGPQVSVAAPADHLYLASKRPDGAMVDSWGTSDSAALVSGAAALIRSKYPSMPWYQVDQRLIGTAIPTGSVPNDGTGYGIIDINKAVDASRYPVRANAPNPPYTRYLAHLKNAGQSVPSLPRASIEAGSSGASGTGGQAAAPGASTTSGGGSSVLLIGGIIIVVLLAVIVLVVVLAVRSRSRRGPRNPGGGGGYRPNGYTAPGQQYPQGPHSPAPYPPPGGQGYPQSPYQPGQYQPPQQ